MEFFDKRNWKIYFEWIEGKEYPELAKEFDLAVSSIKEICTSKVPDKIKQNPYFTSRSYRRWRAWKKAKVEQKTLIDIAEVSGTT